MKRDGRNLTDVKGLFLFEITLTEIFIQGFRETLPNLEEAWRKCSRLYSEKIIASNLLFLDLLTSKFCLSEKVCLFRGRKLRNFFQEGR